MSEYRQKAFDALRKFEVNLQSECELYEAIAVLPPTEKRFWGFNGIAMRLKRSVPEVRLSWLLTKKGRICLARLIAVRSTILFPYKTFTRTQEWQNKAASDYALLQELAEEFLSEGADEVLMRS